MPDESSRIRQSVIKTMTSVLLILSVFHRKTSVEELRKCHPKMAIVYNHVSKNADYSLVLERIDKYKSLLLEDTVEFYCETISDDTIVDGKNWLNLKKTVMESTNIEEDEWFNGLTSYQKDLIRSLVFAQKELPDNEYRL